MSETGYLVLTRRAGEKLYIGENIEVVVLETKPGSVKLGLIANTDIRIERGEKRREAA